MAVVDEGGLSSLGRRIQSQSGVPPPTSFSRSRRRFPHCFLFPPMTRGTPYTIRATLAARRVIDTSVSLPPLPARPLPRRPRRRGASATSRAACSSRPSPPARSPSSSTTRCCAREVLRRAARGARQRAVAACAERRLRTTRLRVRTGFHSRCVAPALDAIEAAARDAHEIADDDEPPPRRAPRAPGDTAAGGGGAPLLVSSAQGAALPRGRDALTPAYWRA